MEIVIFLTLKYFVQVAHLALLANFPFFSVSSPSFIMAIVMVFVNHYFAFSYFGENYYPFSEVRNRNYKQMFKIINMLLLYR